LRGGEEKKKKIEDEEKDPLQPSSFNRVYERGGGVKGHWTGRYRYPDGPQGGRGKRPFLFHLGRERREKQEIPSLLVLKRKIQGDGGEKEKKKKRDHIRLLFPSLFAVREKRREVDKGIGSLQSLFSGTNLSPLPLEQPRREREEQEKKGCKGS